MRLEGSRLKLDRANEHIAAMQARIDKLPDSYIATIEIDPVGGHEVIKHDLSDKKAIIDLALMMGDAVHNLKCALDYAWFQAVRRLVPTAVSKFSKFPVYSSRTGLENALKAKNIHTLSPELFNFMVSQVKSFDGGNTAVWFVHRLDIQDKHHLLIPIIEIAAIEGIELQDEQGEVFRGFTWTTEERPPYFVPIAQGLRIKKKGRVSVAVLFDEPSLLSDMEVCDMLSTFSRFIFAVIESFENLLYRLFS